MRKVTEVFITYEGDAEDWIAVTLDTLDPADVNRDDNRKLITVCAGVKTTTVRQNAANLLTALVDSKLIVLPDDGNAHDLWEIALDAVENPVNDYIEGL